MPFVSMFYGTPSHYLWEDSLGRVHTITQGEGGEQGDAMMPLFSLGQHAALERVQRLLREGEVLFAFLDDVYTVSMPDCVWDIHRLLEESLWAESGIRVHEGNPALECHWGESTRSREVAASSGTCRSCSSGVAGIRGCSVMVCAGAVGDAQRTSSHIVGAHSHGRGCAVGVGASGSLHICSGELCGQRRRSTWARSTWATS